MLHQRSFRVFCQRAKREFLAGSIIVSLILSLIPAPVWAQIVSAKSGTNTVNLISLLVEDEMYRQTELKPLILRYANDVAKAQDAEVIITILNKDIQPFEVYEGLAQLYNEGLPTETTPTQLKGVILVGEIPLPVVEKSGNLWPTVFPYTDFYDPSYLWDENKNRFVFQFGANMAPEIWHGVIKAPSENLTTRISQLKTFFEANHRMHSGDILFDKKVFIADLVRQRLIVPGMLYWRYQEWVEFAEEVQYLRYTKHWLRRLYERAEQGGISSGNLSSLTEYEKQALADEILEADGGLTRPEVMESLNSDGLTELPDNFSKNIIDNLVKRYVLLYENWITQANTRVEESGRWTAQDLDNLPALVSMKDELSVLKLRYFNDEIEKALLAAVNEANVPHDVAMPHTVVVPYEEGGPDGGTNYTNKPAYWNGVRPSSSMTAEDCTLIRGSNRNNPYPFAQQVEANQSMDIDTVGLCKNAAEPDFNSDKFEGCCARNIKYEDNQFGYDTCKLDTAWAGGQSGINSLYHVGAELPVFSQRGTREIDGLEGANGCRAGFAVNEDETYTARFSSLMLHDEPRPSTLMNQVQAQFTRALPVDDPRGFSFLDHGEAFHRLSFPNIFTQREAVMNANQLEIAMRNIMVTQIDRLNTITEAGNELSEQAFDNGLGFAGRGSVWFPPEVESTSTAPGGKGGGGGGGDDECQISMSVQGVDDFTQARRWIGCGGRFTKFYETGDTLDEDIFESALGRFSWEELYEALAWIDLNIEEKNKQVFQTAMSSQGDFNQFFEAADFKGYEVVQIMGNGSTEQGMEMAFLPEDFDPDFEFLEARAEEAAYVFDDSEPAVEFLGTDFADTFLNAEAEAECDSIPNTTLTWPLRIACSLKATTTATTKQVSVGPNLGTNAPLEPIIEDLEVSLQDKRLVVTPEDIFVSSKARDLIEVKVELNDLRGELETGDFSTNVTLEFDSTDANDFFEVSPAKTVPLVGGEITFFLVPKGREVGGQFNMQAVARNANNSGKKLTSTLVPIRLGVYRLWGKPDKRELVVGDTVGTNVEIKILDTNDATSRAWEGETLEFTSEGGTFENYGEAIIENGVAEITFLPGVKTGEFEIQASHEGEGLPSFSTKVTLLPDLAVDIKTTKKSPYLIAGSFYQSVGAELIDQFDNTVDGVPHQWTWETENLEIQDRPAFDADPRTNGVQMFASFRNQSVLPIRVQADEETASLAVSSDFLADIEADQLDFEVIVDPEFEVELSQTRIEAGSEDLIEATVRAVTKEGDLIADDFTLQIGAEPIVQGRLPAQAELIDGIGTVKFQPGTLAGNFKLRLSYPGFVESLTPFTVLPGDPAKVDLSLPNQNPEAVSFDADSEIDLSVQVFDKYRNLVPDWTGRMNLRATDGTQHLIDLDPTEFNFVRGKKTLAIKPKDLSGTVRLIAEHEDLVLGTLEFKLTSFFKLSDVQDLAPRALLTLLLGWEAGDLRYKQNFATEWLTANKVGGIATLGADPEPAFQYGYMAPDGRLGPRLNAEWVSANYFSTLIKSNNKIIAQAQRYVPLELKETSLEAEPDSVGLWWQPRTVKNKTLTFDRTDNVWRWDGLRVLELGTEGGITQLDRNFTLKATDHLFKWNVYRNRDLLGTLTWVFAEDEIEIKTVFTQNGALEVKLIDPKVFTLESLVGDTNNDEYGYVLLDQNRSEPRNRILGSMATSIENETGTNYLAWGPDWGAAAHLAAGETVGNALKYNASDIMIFYGDPSLSVKTENQTSPKTGFTQDIGQPIFQTPEGRISDLFVIDADLDGLNDVIAIAGSKLWVSRQMSPTANGRLQYKEPELWLQVPGGVKASLLLQSNSSNDWQWLQLDFNNQLTAWAWVNGKFEPSEVTWPQSSPIESFQTGTLDDDGFTDLVVVDENHTLWRWSWLGDDRWISPEEVYKFPPNFVFTDETLEDPNLNLKLGFISYQGIEEDGVLQGNTTKIKTSPEARPVIVTPDNLDEALLGSYFDETIANSNLISFVSFEDSEFLGRADYSTSSSALQVTPGEEIEVEFRLAPTETLDRVQILLPNDTYFSYVEDSLTCTNCGGDIEIVKQSRNELFWAEFPRLQRGTTTTLRWKLKVEALPDLTVAVGDFEQGFDQLDDMAVAWSEGEDPIMLYFMSSKTADENPVVKAINDENEVVEVSDEAIESAFNSAADPDGDGVPASHDHYPDTANGPESIGAGLLPGMIAGAIGGLTASMLQGGGSCFHQPMSKAQNAPGLGTNYNPPHATPGGKSGGRCSTCLKNLRTYNMPTSTGRSANAVCLGRKRPNMASPAETDNCFVSTARQEFNETCPDSGTNPDTSRMLNKASSFTRGSLNFQIPGNFDAASLNSKLQTQSGPIVGRLTAGIDKGMAWSSEQFVDLNRKTAEAGPGADRSDNSPSFAGQSGPNHLRPEGPLEEAQNNLEAGDTVNFTREPVPVQIPSTSASDLKAAEASFTINKESFETELEAVIPKDTENFQTQLQAVIEAYPAIVATELGALPEQNDLQLAFRSYQQQLRDFAADYKAFCLETPANQDREGCKVAQTYMLQAQTDFNKLRTLQETGVEALFVARGEAASAIETLAAQESSLTPALEDYTNSLTSAVEARRAMESFVQKFTENFENTTDLITTATDRVLQIREVENQVMAAVTQMTDIYAKQQEAFQAIEAQTAREWAATSAVNEAQHSAEQGVRNQFNNFALTYQTDVVDRGSLLPWKTNNGINGDMPVTRPPVFPQIKQEAANSTPGRMDVNLPEVQVETVDIGAIESMEEAPPMPVVSNDLTADIEGLNFKRNPLSELRNLEQGISRWQNLSTALSADVLFPTLSEEAELEGTFTTLPSVPENLNLSALNRLAALTPETVPERLDPVEIPVLPQVNTVPKMVQPPLDFAANLPQIPIDQKPFTPPAPATLPKVGNLLAAAQPALQRMSKAGAYRIGASPVSEWYVKPHVERRTGRTSLDGNRDFTAAALEFKPYAEVAQNLVIESGTGINSMFDSLGDNWQNFSGGLNEALSFPNNPNLPSVSTPLPTESVEVSGILPSQAWAQIQQSAWQYRGLMPSLASWEDWVLATDPMKQHQSEAWLNEHRERWAAYNHRLKSHQQTLLAENTQLKALAEQDKLAFWKSPQALALVPALGRQFTADEPTNLNFSVPLRELVYTPLSINLPDESTFDYDYFNAPSFNQPGNNVEDLLSTGVVSNSGEGALTDKEKEELRTAGLKPGMYYARNETLGVDLLHKIRFYGAEAQTAGDLDGDGLNEVLYTLRQNTVYVKKSPNLAPTVNRPGRLKQWTQAEFLAAELPLVTYEGSPFWNRIPLDIRPLGNLDNKFYEWQLRSKIDGLPEIIHGALTQSAIEPQTLQPMLGKVTALNGNVTVAHLSRVNLPVRTREACLALAPFQIYYEDVLIQAGNEASTIWTYLHPLRGRTAEEKVWTLQPGQSLRLEAADVCLTSGAASWQQTDEEEFTSQASLALGEGLTHGSVLRLGAEATVEVQLANNQNLRIQGPVTYNFHQVQPGLVPDLNNLISYDRFMTYNAIRTYSNGKRSILQSLFPHPSQLPW
jgi:hypothetical protein